MFKINFAVISNESITIVILDCKSNILYIEDRYDIKFKCTNTIILDNKSKFKNIFDWYCLSISNYTGKVKYNPSENYTRKRHYENFLHYIFFLLNSKENGKQIVFYKNLISRIYYILNDKKYGFEYLFNERGQIKVIKRHLNCKIKESQIKESQIKESQIKESQIKESQIREYHYKKNRIYKIYWYSNGELIKEIKVV